MEPSDAYAFIFPEAVGNTPGDSNQCSNGYDVQTQQHHFVQLDRKK